MDIIFHQQRDLIHKGYKTITISEFSKNVNFASSKQMT